MSMSNEQKAPASPAAPAPAQAVVQSSRRREITSAELFAGGREINIRHADEIYTLRQTNKGKLILTK
jgi:hemin uptake protein HemP